jgi:arylsulfatase A-like enzyme/Flp pilus assembly protein TadD
MRPGARKALAIAIGVSILALAAVVMLRRSSLPVPGVQAVQTAPRAGSGPPLNVLLISLDTTRADRLGCYGYQAALTPALDALAAGGTLFEQAFTSCPQTLPAHASLFTGLEPPEHGVRVNGRDRLEATIPTLAETLAANGYRTSAFVAAFVLNSKFGLNRGFQTYDEDLTGAEKQEVHEPLSVYRPGNLVTDAALAWLERTIAERSQLTGATPDAGPPPFFCWVHLFDPHYPHHAHAALAGTPFEGVASYDAEVAFMDRQIARLTAFLQQHDLVDRTLVIAVADHGEGLGDHGETEHGYLLYDEVLRVPLIVSLPGVVRAGARIIAVVSLADLFATVLDLLGFPAETPGAGRSLKPALTGAKEIASLPSYAETELPYSVYGWSPLRSLTTPQWKYVRTARPELYDRETDPKETKDLARAQQEKAGELDAALSALEAGMARRAAPVVTLDAQQKQQLESLGYVVGGPAAAPGARQGSLRDIKDMLPVKHLESQLLRAKSLGMINDATSLEISRELVQLSPETGSFQNRLGATLLGAGRVEEALDHLTQAVRLRPDLAVAHSNLGAALARQGKLEEAIARYTEALRLERDVADTHYRMANALADQGKLDAALEHYAETIRLQPDYAVAHYNMATVLAQRNEPDAAIEHYVEAIRFKADFPEAHHNVASLLVQQGKGTQAIEHFAAAVRLAPDFAAAHYGLAQALEAQGQFADAIRHYEEALRVRPQEPVFFNALASLLATSATAELRDGARAVELAEKACTLTRQADARMLRTLAAAYAEARRFDDAARTARKAQQLARSQGQAELARDIESQAVAYEAGQRGKFP